MLKSISVNNLKTIEELIRLESLDTMIVVGSHSELETLCHFIEKNLVEVKHLVYFAQGKYVDTLRNFSCLKRSNSWPLKRYVDVSEADGLIRIEGSLYEHDQPRIEDIKRFYRLNLKLLANLPFLDSMWSKFFLFMLKVFPVLRRSSIYEKLEFGHLTVEVYFDDIFIKDHYGEDPNWLYPSREIEAKLEALVKASRRILVVFVKGPTHKLAEQLLHCPQHDESSARVCVLSAFREEQKNTLKQFKGKFYEGTNINLNDKNVFSQDCLNIGAGLHEMWISQ